MSARTIRAHPLMIARYVKHALFWLILPWVRELFSLHPGAHISQTLLLETALLLVLVVHAWLQWRAFSIELAGSGIRLTSGVLLKREALIRRENLASVWMEARPTLAAFGAVAVRLDTEAGSMRAADCSAILRKRDALALRRLFGARRGGEFNYRCPPRSLALMAAASSSAVTGLLVFAPLVNNAGKLLGRGLSDELVGAAKEISRPLEKTIPLTAGILSLALLGGFALSFLILFSRSARFTVRQRAGRLTLSSGLVGRRTVCFSARAVNAVQIRQTVPFALLRQGSANICLAGHGLQREETAVLAPALNLRAPLAPLDRLVPEIPVREPDIRAPKRTHMHFLLPGLIAIGLILSGGVAAILLWTDLTAFIVLLALAALLLCVFHLFISERAYRSGGISATEGTICTRGSGAFALSTLCVPAGRLAEAVLVRRGDICSVRVRVRSQRATKQRARRLPAVETRDALLKVLKDAEK